MAGNCATGCILLVVSALSLAQAREFEVLAQMIARFN